MVRHTSEDAVRKLLELCKCVVSLTMLNIFINANYSPVMAITSIENDCSTSVSFRCNFSLHWREWVGDLGLKKKNKNPLGMLRNSIPL